MSRALRPLALDFRATRTGSRWMAWVLALAAIGFSAELGVSYRRAREAIAQAETRLARVERPAQGAGQSRGAKSPTPEEIAHARDSYLRLTLPWHDLFRALESTPLDKVVLLAIEPDPKSGTVLISGEGAGYPAVLDYVAVLQRTKIFERVHLVRHEIRHNDPLQPAAFTVSASWSEARR
jgi:hypothetical protein